MKLILNIFLSLLARGLLYILSVPLVILSTMIALCGGNASEYYRLVAIVLDIVGNVIGGPVWNVIFFKRGSKPTVKFGGVITMSFVFAHNLENLNWFAKLFYHAIEKADPGHFENAKTPSYLKTYLIYWN